MADIKASLPHTASGAASTIYDVSALAGVSTSTVSRSFGRPNMISKATREKVFAAAAQLNFRPNTLAGALTTKRTLLVGLITADIQNPFVAALARGVQDGIAARRYLSIICSTDGDAGRELELLQEMLARGVDGFIITPTPAGPDEDVLSLLSKLPGRGTPVVFIGPQPVGTSNDFASSGAKRGQIDAVNHLISLGHRRIGFIGGYYSKGVAVDRLEGYREVLRDHNLPRAAELAVETETTTAGGLSAMHSLLDLAEPPTAVMVVNDLAAVGALDACRARGVRVPADMSVVGFDNIPIAAMTTPPLSTVAQPAYDLGHTAAELVLNRLDTPELPAQQRVLGCKLVVRGSTAPPTS